MDLSSSGPETESAALAALGFLEGPHGDIPVASWSPVALEGRAACVIHCPAFAEEMNRSRHMVALQARRFAAAGYTVLVPDLFGTGDSPAELADASWARWREEILFLISTARDAGFREVVLWGLRLGCVLAVESAASVSLPLDGLLLWQPVYAGRQQLARFLRLGAAGAMLAGGQGTASPTALRTQLEAGEGVDIAGYNLTPSLYGGINSAHCDHPIPEHTRIAVLEVVASPEKSLSPATTAIAGQWSNRGLEVVAGVVVGESFWVTQELGFAPALVERSITELMRLTRATASGAAGTPPIPLSKRSPGAALRTVEWQCAGDWLCGILHESSAATHPELGMVIVVGGPQYRVGSHRQFVHLAASQADAGIPSLRFDYRGMGDAAGALGGFLTIGPDVRSAVDALQREYPTVREVVLWGLCDAATAAFAYAPTDSRITGIVAANPWVYSPAGSARVRITRYYLERLASGDFWRKLLRGRLRLASSVTDFARTLVKAFSLRRSGSSGALAAPPASLSLSGGSGAPETDLVLYVASAAARCEQSILLLLSDHDYTAREFEQARRQNRHLARALDRDNVCTVHIQGADHTFSQRRALEAVASMTRDFLLLR